MAAWPPCPAPRSQPHSGSSASPKRRRGRSGGHRAATKRAQGLREGAARWPTGRVPDREAAGCTHPCPRCCNNAAGTTAIGRVMILGLPTAAGIAGAKGRQPPRRSLSSLFPTVSSRDYFDYMYWNEDENFEITFQSFFYRPTVGIHNISQGPHVVYSAAQPPTSASTIGMRRTAETTVATAPSPASRAASQPPVCPPRALLIWYSIKA